MEDIENVAKGLTESIQIPTESISKEDRIEAHQFIRNKYNNKLLSNGRNNQIEITRVDNPLRNKRDNRWVFKNLVVMKSFQTKFNI